jgi:hypothetical protein
VWWVGAEADQDLKSGEGVKILIHLVTNREIVDMGQVNYMVWKLRNRAHTGKAILRWMIDVLEASRESYLYQLEVAVKRLLNPDHRFFCLNTYNFKCDHYLYLFLSQL